MNGSDLSDLAERNKIESANAAELGQVEKTGDYSARSVLKTILLPIGAVAGFLIATFPLSLPALYGLALLLLYYLN